jgi:hypothetical protein
MTIEQTVEIPVKPPLNMLHLDLPLPEDHPSGKVKVEVRLIQEEMVVSEPPVQYTEIDRVRYKVPTEEEAHRWREEAIKNDPQVQEILKDGAAQAETRKADPSLRSLKKWHGVLENSKAWGKDVDVVMEIRKMRDEWGDPWEEAGGRNR